MFWDILGKIFLTPIIFALSIVWALFTAVGGVIYYPIEFLLILWGKENDL